MEQKWWTLIAVCIGIFMLLIDITVVNVALPQIQRSLHSSFSDLQWVVNAYALTLAALLLTAGSLADLRRAQAGLPDRPGDLHRRLADLRPRAEPADAERLARRAGDRRRDHARDLARADRRRLPRAATARSAFAAYGAVIGAAVAIGPLVGGALTSGLGWRWIFFVNVPIGVGAVVLTLRSVAESRDPDATRRRLARAEHASPARCSCSSTR